MLLIPFSFWRHRAGRAQCVQCGIQGRLEEQISVCSQVSDLAGGGRATDLLAVGWGYQWLNINVLSTPLAALHQHPFPSTHCAELSSHCPTPICCYHSTEF